MLRTRVFPILLYRGQGLCKGIRFEGHKYVGDVLNAVRIFNTKQVDELVLIDIGATAEDRTISPDLVKRVSQECLMPLTVGGGIRLIDDAQKLLAAGAEKVTINTAGFERPDLISKIASTFGSQSVVASIDARKRGRGWQAMTRCGANDCGLDAVDAVRAAQEAGAGEILLTSIDREGTGEGYDTDLIHAAAGVVQLPLIANGGAASLAHMRSAIEAGASAVAAGSMFVFHGRRRAVLISFPSRPELESALG